MCATYLAVPPLHVYTNARANGLQCRATQQIPISVSENVPTMKCCVSSVCMHLLKHNISGTEGHQLVGNAMHVARIGAVIMAVLLSIEVVERD